MPGSLIQRQGKMVLYQILVRLFGNSVSQPVANGTKEENGCGTFENLSNEALQSIKELGITHIWLTGILRHATQTDYSQIGLPAQHLAVVKGKAGSPYAITDFFELDPDLSKHPEKRWDSFSKCLDRIHAQGLAVVIDFIPNHTARQYSSKKGKEILGWDLGEEDNIQQAFHPQNNYYYLPEKPLQLEVNQADVSGTLYTEFPAKATGNDSFTDTPSHFDWFETAKLNYGLDYQFNWGHFDPIPKTWLYMREVLRFWAGKGIDGFRCDMVEMVPVPFWAWVVPQIKVEFPAVFFLGEVYNPALYREFLHDALFDFLYDKVEMYDEIRALVEGKGDANKLTQVWQKQEGFGERMLRFLENHDEQRIASELVGKDPFRALPAMAVAAWAGKGPVMVYFGQELGERVEGESGFSGDDGKTTIFDYWNVPTIQQWQNGGRWNEAKLTPDQVALRKAYSKILNLAQQNETICSGGFFELQYANQQNPHFSTNNNYAFLRFTDTESLLIVASFSIENQWLRIVIPYEAWQALGVDTGKSARLIDLLEEQKTVSFFPSATFISDGGSAGLVISIQAFGYRIFSVQNDR